MYYKVKHGTKEHDTIVRFKKNREDWSNPEIKNKLKDLLGVDGNVTLLCSPTKLIVDWKDLHRASEEVRSQFSKKDKDGYYDAKKASNINREWVKFCKSLNMKKISFADLLFELGGSWIFYPPIKLEEMFDDFYFECATKDIENEACLEKIEEHEYYLIKSNWSKENK